MENSDGISKEEEEYEVERIVGHKIVKNKSSKNFKYFIKWLNYDAADNTWEKEENVYAIDMIAQYWNNKPKNDKDRILFESIQSKKKNPILLTTPAPTPAKVAKVITASPSPPSSPVLNPSTEFELNTVPIITEKPSIASFFTPKKDIHTSIASSSTSHVKPIVKPQQTILNVFKATDIGKGKEKSSAVDSYSTHFSEDDTIIDVTTDMETPVEEYKTTTLSSSEEDEEDLAPRNSKKRTRSAYTDYFTEQHKKKKRIGKSPVQEKVNDVDSVSSVEMKETDTIIFDEAFTVDPVRDWSELAVKIEYIGKEVDDGPIYCAVKWKDDAVSLHSLDLVRTKRPDLVIDAFVKSVYNQ